MPWRVRRLGERLALWQPRFGPGLDAVEVGSGPATASLLATGDIVLEGELEGLVRGEGPEAVLGSTRALLCEADLRVGNLEALLTRASRPCGETGVHLRGDPEMARVLQAAAFDCVSVANNHCLDFGAAGLLESLGVLRDAGIQAVGAGPDAEAARRPAALEAAGLRVGVLAYADDYRCAPDELRRATPAPSRDDWILEDVRAHRDAFDLLVVQLHWGYEFQLFPLLHHRDRARGFAEAGADVVLCHHAHVPMGIEAWQGRLIAHGLGNFIGPLDPYLLEGHPLTDRSIALRIEFGREGVRRATLHPVGIRPDGAVALLGGGERAGVLGILRGVSRGLSDERRMQRIRDDRLAREAIALVRRIGELAGARDARALEEARALEAPRQRELCEWLARGFAEPGLEVAEFLEALRRRAGDADGTFELAAMARGPRWRRSLDALARQARLAEDMPGRTP